MRPRAKNLDGGKSRPPLRGSGTGRVRLRSPFRIPVAQEGDQAASASTRRPVESCVEHPRRRTGVGAGKIATRCGVRTRSRGQPGGLAVGGVVEKPEASLEREPTSCPPDQALQRVRVARDHDPLERRLAGCRRGDPGSRASTSVTDATDDPAAQTLEQLRSSGRSEIDALQTLQVRPPCRRRRPWSVRTSRGNVSPSSGLVRRRWVTIKSAPELSAASSKA